MLDIWINSISLVLLLFLLIRNVSNFSGYPIFIFRSIGIISLSFILIYISMFKLGLDHLVSVKVLLCSVFIFSTSILVLSFSEFRDDYQNRFKVWAFYLLVITGLSAFLLFQLNYQLTFEMRETLDGNAYIYFPTKVKYLFLFIIFNFIFSFYYFEELYKGLKSSYHSSMVWLILLPTLILLIYSLYGISYAILYSSLTVNYFVWLARLIFVTIFSLFYTIIKRKFKGYYKLNREIIHSSSSLFYLGIYFILISIISKILNVFEITLNGLFSVVALIGIVIGLIVIIMSSTLKARFSEFVDRSIFREQIDYRQVWRTFSSNISSIVDLNTLIQEVLRSINILMNVRDSQIFLKKEKTNIFQNNCSSDKLKIVNIEEEWLLRNGKALFLSSIEFKINLGDLYNQLKTKISINSDLVISPLISKRVLIGILICEPKNEKSLNYHKLELLNTLSLETALAIQSLQSNIKLLEARELESFNKMSTFVIHDIKNLISRLNLLVNNAETRINNPEFQRDMLQTISNTIGSMAQLINKLKFSGRGNTNRIYGPVSNTLLKVINDLKIEQNPAVQFEYNSSINGHKTYFDEQQLYTVFYNILKNSLEAMPNGGRLAISNSIQENKFKIEIADSGLGMNKAFINKKLFHPFTTTKRKGLGVGLYQSKAIIDAHGGQINVKSELNKGTTFHILLPIIEH